MATNEEDRAPRPKTDVAENRKNGPILSVKSTHPSKVPASASAKRLLSLLDGPEKPRGYGGRGATTKRPRTEVARPPSAAASNPASKNSFSLLPFRANPNDASSRPKNVLDIYAAAMLPPSRQPAAAAAARPKPRQEGRQSSTNAHAFASNPQQIVQFQSKVNATTETSKSVSTVTPHSNAPLLARTSTTTTSRQLPSHIVAKLQKNSMKPTKHCVDSSEASRGRDHARNVAVSFAPTTRSVDATSRERTTFVAVDDTSKRVPPSIGMAGFRNRPKVSAPTRFVDRQNAPKDLRELPPSSAMDRPPLGNDSSANDQGATQDLAGSDPSATEILVSLSEQPPPGRWEAAPATLASTLTIPKLNRDIDGGSATGRKTKPKKGTDNFVRLNLKNSSGSCRGKRNVRRSKWRVAMSERGAYSRTTSVHVPQESFVSTTDLMDPVDDFLDGVYSPENDEDPGSQSGSSSSRVQSSNAKQQRQRKLNASCQIPNCRVHNRPCKLCTVKKTSNKGRKFWVCSLPREEQCQHFQWAEDSQQAAQLALLRNKEFSGFVARRVASYMHGLALFTVPELREWMDRRSIAYPRAANKTQLKTKIAIWVRDQVASTVPEREKEQEESNSVTAIAEENTQAIEHVFGDAELFDEISEDDSSTSTDSSDEELEVLDSDTKTLCGRSTGLDLECRHGGANDRDLDEEPASPPVSGCPVKQALKSLFGYSRFRHGQEWAIQRCMDNKRTLLVAPTGFGKSLCYAIPAALKEGVCIVVSPLLSLIQDQLRMLPPQLAAVTLSGSVSTALMASTLDDIIRNRIKIVFVSPERLASSSFRRLFRAKWNAHTASYERRFPKVSLLCVDEAHCLSQWAHNFRPSFLRLRSVLDLVQPESILAVTATASVRVIEDISQQLRLDQGQVSAGQPESGVLVLKTNRDNIDVSAFVLSTQEERLNALIALLSPFKHSRESTSKYGLPRGCLSQGSVIVYVWRQIDAEVVAENIQASSVNGEVVVYHGGMRACEREKAQSRFFRGKARICVATVAFGLGIDKSDVRGVIHMSLASSAEHYLQEIGRAGRDGNPAKAIALILPDEVLVRHSLSHSDLICRSQTQRLLEYVRHTVKDSLSILRERGMEHLTLTIGLPIGKMAVGCDCKAETVETLLSLFELSDGCEAYAYVEGVSYDNVTLAPKRRQLRRLAESEPVAQALLSCSVCVDAPAGESSKSRENVDAGTSRLVTRSSFGTFEFSVAKCASVLGPSAESRHVFAALRRLEKAGEIDLALDTSPAGKALLLRLTPFGTKLLLSSEEEEIDSLIDRMHERLTYTVRAGARKSLEINRVMLEVSLLSEGDNRKEFGQKSASLVKFQELVKEYLESHVETEEVSLGPTGKGEKTFLEVPSRQELSSTVLRVQAYLTDLESGLTNLDEMALRVGDTDSSDYTALAITKFLHGIGPSRWSATVLRGNHFFGRLQGVRFDVLETAVRHVL